MRTGFTWQTEWQPNFKESVIHPDPTVHQTSAATLSAEQQYPRHISCHLAGQWFERRRDAVFPHYYCISWFTVPSGKTCRLFDIDYNKRIFLWCHLMLLLANYQRSLLQLEQQNCRLYARVLLSNIRERRGRHKEWKINDKERNKNGVKRETKR